MELTYHEKKDNTEVEEGILYFKNKSEAHNPVDINLYIIIFYVLSLLKTISPLNGIKHVIQVDINSQSHDNIQLKGSSFLIKIKVEEWKLGKGVSYLSFNI